MEKQNYKKENIERKYLKNIQKNQFLKVKNSLLELENQILQNRRIEDVKDREVKLKREVEELFFKSIIVSIDRFEQKEMQKISPIWLIG